MKIANVLLLATGSIFTLASADDGALTFGGNPSLLKGHPTIRMESEKIVVTVGEKWADVDCRFVFKNHGPACKVRMGFPDYGEGADDTAYNEKVQAARSKRKQAPPFNGFESFKSWVDGKPAKISLLKMDPETAKSWHAKDVSFGANQTRIVHDVYRAYVGGGATNTGHLSETSYVLHTGASWKDTIGDVDVTVVFNRKAMGSKLAIKPVPDPNGSGAFGYDGWNKEPKGMVMWSGFTKPTIQGSTLRFHGKDLKPTKASDIYVAFEFHRGTGE